MINEEENDSRTELTKVISMEAAIFETLSGILPESEKIPLVDLDVDRVISMIQALDAYRLTQNSQFFQFRQLSGDALLNLKGQYLKSLEEGRHLVNHNKGTLSEDEYDDQLEQLTGIVDTIRKIDMELTIRSLYGYVGEPVRRGIE